LAYNSLEQIDVFETWVSGLNLATSPAGRVYTLKHIHGTKLLERNDVLFPDLQHLILFLGLGKGARYVPWIESITLEAWSTGED
jgi:hypothetical protein